MGAVLGSTDVESVYRCRDGKIDIVANYESSSVDVLERVVNVLVLARRIGDEGVLRRNN